MPPEKKRHQKCLLPKEICLLMWIVMNKKYWSRIREMAAISQISHSIGRNSTSSCPALMQTSTISRIPVEFFSVELCSWLELLLLWPACMQRDTSAPQNMAPLRSCQGGNPQRLNKWCQELKAKFYHISFGLASLGLYTHHQIPIWIPQVSNQNSLKYN